MVDTVVVTAPDANSGVLYPTLSDTIFAAQIYAQQTAAAQAVVLAAEAAVNNSENVAINAAASASASAAAAAAAAGGGISATVALLPAGTEGLQAFATNGRKIGQGPGAGDGVRVYFSAGFWRCVS